MARTPRFPTPRIRRSATDRRARRPQLVLQSLEDRAVPAGTHIDISASDRFTVTNADGEAIQLNVSRVGGNYKLEITNSTFTIDAGDAGTIHLSNGDRTATIDTDDVGSFVFNMGDKDDTLTIGNGSVDNFDRVTVHGGVGADSLVVDDSTDDNSLPYSISNTLVTRQSGTFTTTYDTIEQVSLTAGTQNNTINLVTLDPAVALTVNGGGGSDQINLNAADPSISLTVKGGVGNDTLTVNDQSLSTAINYTVGGTTIQRVSGPTTGTITYQTLETINLAGTSGANDFTTESAAPDTSFPAIDIDGNGGTNHLIVNDAAVTDPKTYGISTSKVTRNGSGDITFSSVATLEVKAGTGDDTIKITNTVTTLPLTVNAGLGNDTVNAGGGSMDGLTGTPTFTPGGGSDTLLVDDSTNATDNTEYTIDATKVSRTTSPARSVPYDAAGFESVVLSAGIRAKKITVSDTAAATGFTVNTGNHGVEVLVQATAANSPVAVNGGSSDDTVRVGTDLGGLSGLNADVTVNTGGGTSDVIQIKDAAYMTAATYTVTSTQVTSTDATRGTITINYSGPAENLSLSTGAAANTITIAGTAAGTSLTVNGGVLNDTINVGNGTLNNLGGPVAINAGGVTNTLNVNDGTITTENQTYKIAETNDNEITRTGNVAITYDQISTLNLDSGKGKNTIIVGDKTPTSPSTGVAVLNVNGNEDEDTFDVTGAALAQNSLNTFNSQGASVPLDLAADTFTVSPALLTRNVTITVNGGESVLPPADELPTAPVDHLVARAATMGETETEGENTFVKFDSEAQAKGQIDFTGIEDVGFETSAITPIPTAPTDQLEVTITGPNSGKFKQTGKNEKSFSGATQVTWGGNALVLVDSGNANKTYNLSLGAITVAGLTVTYTGAQNVSVTGGKGADTFTITNVSPDVVLTVNGGDNADNFIVNNAPANAPLTMNGGDGADTFTIASIPATAALAVDGGDGDDIVHIGSGSLDSVAGSMTLTGGTGTDSVVVDDSANTAANTYRITANTVTRNGSSPSINLGAGFESAAVNAGTGKDSIFVEATAANLPVTVDAGGGDDTITVGQGVSLASILGPLTVSGGPAAGTDSLLLDDSIANGPNIYRITGTLVSRPTVGPIAYDKIDTLTLNATSLDDTFNVEGTAAGTQVTVNAGDGIDVVNVSSVTPAGTLNDLDGPLTVNGGGQADVLNINESAGPADTVAVYATGKNITGTAGAGWTVNTGADLWLGGINILTGTLGDTVNVVRTLPGEQITIDTGLGSDNVSVGGGLLSNVSALLPVLVAGAGDTDTLTLDDSANPTANDYLVTEVNVAITIGSLVFPYLSQGFEQLILAAGTQDDRILVANTGLTPSVVPVTVRGGAGSDLITVGNGTLDGLQALVDVQGGSDAATTDRLAIDDRTDRDGNTYTLDGVSVLRVGAGPIHYTGFEELALLAADLGDSIQVVGTAAGSQTTVSAGGGDDAVTAIGNSGPLTLDAGDGSDFIKVGDGTFQDLRGPVQVDGGLGGDQLTVSAAADSGPNSYAITGAAVSRSTGLPVTVGYTTVEGLVFNAGIGDDHIDIPATSVPTTVNAGLGSDLVVAGVGTLDNLLPDLTLIAGAGDIDSLRVDDSADLDNNLYAVTDLAVSRNNGISFDYPAEGFEVLDLLAGTGNDQIHFESTALGVPVTANAGNGDDVIRIGNGGLDAIRSAIGINGGIGIDDELVVDDSGSTPHEYALTVDVVTRLESPVLSIGYSGMDALSLFAGSANDKITVLSTAANVPVAVFGGDGSDLIDAGGGTLDHLDGPLTAVGGDGKDTLSANDSSDDDNNAYSIARDSVTRAGGTPVDVGYEDGFEFVWLLAGTGNDTILADSATTVTVSADGGDGNDSFALNFLSGAVRGGAGDDIIFGDDKGRQYAITGPDSGSIAGILGGGFTQVENLTAGASDDVFLFLPGGTLSGAATGGAGRDMIIGDSGNNIFQLTGAGSGSIDARLGSFNTIELLSGEAGDDKLVVGANAPAGSLAQFDGGDGKDTADFLARPKSQSISIKGVGTSGYELTGGTAANGSAIISGGVLRPDAAGLLNIDTVIGSEDPEADTDTLTSDLPSPGPVRRNALWMVKAGTNASFVRPDNNADFTEKQGFTSLVFKNFEKLAGSPDNDRFTIDLSAGKAFTSSLFVRGDVAIRPGGTDSLVVIGTDQADKFSMLHRTKLWPNGQVGEWTQPSEAGIQVNAEPRLNYNLIEDVDLQGGAGVDTFTVDPGSKLPRFPRPRQPNPNPLYGLEMQSLTLEGGTETDRFEIVPDRPGNKFPLLPTYVKAAALVRRGVTINVYGASKTTAATPSDQDQVFLYRLAARIKANFPNGDAKPSGPRKQTLWLWFLGYEPVNYFDMWKVTASIGDTPEQIIP